MFFSPLAIVKQNHADLWPQFQNFLELLLWTKGVDWVKVLNALGLCAFGNVLTMDCLSLGPYCHNLEWMVKFFPNFCNFEMFHLKHESFRIQLYDELFSNTGPPPQEHAGIIWSPNGDHTQDLSDSQRFLLWYLAFSNFTDSVSDFYSSTTWMLSEVNFCTRQETLSANVAHDWKWWLAL